MQDSHRILIVSAAVVFVLATVRCLRTDRAHPDRGTRRDMALLAFLLLLASAGDAARAVTPVRSRLFLLESVALVPLALGAIFLLWRLIKSFRASHTASADVAAGRNSSSRRNG